MAAFLQLLINSLIAGSIYFLVASGFSLTYSVAKFLSFFLVLALAVLLGMAIDFLVYRSLRRKKASTAILLIASLAMLTMLNSLLLLFFGSAAKTVKIFNPAYDFLGARITLVQIWIIAIALLAMGILWLVSYKTRIGKAMRALSDNKDVAQTVGINPERIYLHAFAISSVLAAVAGMLLGIEQNLYPHMGVMLIIKGFAATVIGGLGMIHGTAFGSYLLGIAENFGIWYLPSGYKDAISFALLFVFLLFRPYGIFGRKKREDVA